MKEKNTTNIKKFKIESFGEERWGTGFFCKIPYKNSVIQVLITHHSVVYDFSRGLDKKIKVCVNFKEYNLNVDKNQIIYSSYECNIVIIRINEQDNINNFFELDEKIYNNELEIFCKKHFVYMLSFSKDENPRISFGDAFEKISDFEIKHICFSEVGSSGAPILDYYSNKVIGIHIRPRIKSSKEIDYRIGTFLKYPLDELNKKNWFYNSKK